MHQESTGRRSSSARRLPLLALAATVLAFQAAGARADVLNFSTNINPQLFGNAMAPVDLGTAAGLQATLPFATAANDLVEITFSAECSVQGTPVQWGSIQIEVDPAGAAGFTPIPPTVGPDDAFCSGAAGAGWNDSWVTPSMTVVTRVPAGAHLVRVLANSIGAGAVLRLDDLSITVDN
jgi:hypothetical protein